MERKVAEFIASVDPREQNSRPIAPNQLLFSQDSTNNLVSVLHQLSTSEHDLSNFQLSAAKPQQQLRLVPLSAEQEQLISEVWGAVRQAVFHFLSSTPSQRISKDFQDEHNPTIRGRLIKTFSDKIISNLRASRPSNSPNIVREFSILICDQEFEAKLEHLVQNVVDALFSCDNKTEHVRNSDKLERFHWRIQCWFLLRDMLDSFLQPFWSRNIYISHHLEVYKMLDDLLCKQEAFSRVIMDIRTTHTKFLERMRQASVIMAYNYEKKEYRFYETQISHKEACAIQSFFYFLRLCGSKTIDNKSAIAYHLSQLRRFHNNLRHGYVMRKLKQLQKDVCDEDRPSLDFEGLLSFAQKMSRYIRAERLISLHAFGNQNMYGYSGLVFVEDLEVVNHVGRYLSKDALITLRVEDKTHSLYGAFDYFRYLEGDRGIHFLQKLLREHCHNLFLNVKRKRYGRYGAPIYSFEKYLTFFENDLPPMKHFRNSLCETLWDALGQRYSADDPLQFLTKVFLELNNRAGTYARLPRISKATKSLAWIAEILLGAFERNQFIRHARQYHLERYLQGEELSTAQIAEFHNTFDSVIGKPLPYFEKLEYNSKKSIGEVCEGPDEHANTVPLADEMTESASRGKEWTTTDDEDRFQPYLRLHNVDGSLNFGPATDVLHLNSIVAIDAQTIEEKNHHHFLELPRDISMANKYTASYYRSLYPNRNISRISYLSTVEISSSYFSESPDQPLSFIVNLYQACVLRFFEKYQSATLSQIVRHLIVDDITDEQYKQEKIRVRQALISLSSENAPLLVCEIGSEGHEIRFKLNEDWRTSKIEGLLVFYVDAYISCLDREQESVIRGLVEKEILKVFSKERKERQLSKEYLTMMTMNRNIHDCVGSQYVVTCIEGLIDRGHIHLDETNQYPDSPNSPDSDYSYDSNNLSSNSDELSLDDVYAE